MTEYLVLYRDKQHGWTEKGHYTAVNSRLAIKEALNGVGNPPQETWVAVPARSWQPVKVAVETALKFS